MKAMALTMWEESTNDFVEYFEKRYFGKVDTDSYWVAKYTGGTYVIADYFFSLDDMVAYVRYSYSKDEMFKHYNYSLEALTSQHTVVCIRDYRKLKNHD